MQKLNEFITNNQADLQRFFDDILVCVSLPPLMSCLTLLVLKGASNLTPSSTAIPAQVKKNALADIYNVLLASKQAVYKDLSEQYEEGDPFFVELDALLAGDPIPSEQA